MQEYLRFRRFVTPVVIEVVFWLEVAGSFVSALIFLIDGTPEIGIPMLFLGPVFARISCELIMVQFGIYDVLRQMKDAGQRPGNPAP